MSRRPQFLLFWSVSHPTPRPQLVGETAARTGLAGSGGARPEPLLPPFFQGIQACEPLPRRVWVWVWEVVSPSAMLPREWEEMEAWAEASVQTAVLLRGGPA